jgi:hypothetical protein
MLIRWFKPTDVEENVTASIFGVEELCVEVATGFSHSSADFYCTFQNTGSLRVRCVSFYVTVFHTGLCDARSENT